MDRIAIHQERDLWEAVVRMLSYKVEILTHTSIAVVFRDTNGSVRSREIGRHHLPDLPLGVHFTWCGNRSCRPMAGDTTFKNHFLSGRPRSETEKLKQICRRCGYESAWVKIKDIGWSHQFPGQQPVYWHNYPLTQPQIMTFGNGQVVKKKGPNLETGPGKVPSSQRDSPDSRAGAASKRKRHGEDSEGNASKKRTTTT